MSPQAVPTRVQVRVRVTVSVYRTDRSMSNEQLELRDTLDYDEWDVAGLGRLLRRLKGTIAGERRRLA